ncbi:MAG: 50S ribosomal protein L29 [Gammaproteobacteria bacterium]|nr:MAG: 50S ribosomal protein L29 [Gammaproteobacteria bacterium]RLA15739.1 MAG: 50S ribosomal protein L29 [Gammaproteobacteria bacterium]
MTAQKLREQSVEELKELLKQGQREQFNLRVQRATGELTNYAQFKKIGREIARIKTILNEIATQGES